MRTFPTVHILLHNICARNSIYLRHLNLRLLHDYIHSNERLWGKAPIVQENEVFLNLDLHTQTTIRDEL